MFSDFPEPARVNHSVNLSSAGALSAGLRVRWTFSSISGSTESRPYLLLSWARCWAVGLILFAAALGLRAQEAVRITEFMAVNQAALADEDGDFPDWLEIHNGGSSPASLGGWHLTDNSGNPDKWTFPAVTLPAGGRLIVFASNKNRSVAGSPLHTNFQLDSDGGYLALLRPNLTIASRFENYPEQVPDVSYGVGLNVTGVPFLLAGAPASVRVPADGSLGASWTAVGFDDSTWNSSLVRNLPSLVITEAGSGEPDFVEIQNVSATALNTSGWLVAASASTPGNPSALNGTLWNLPASVAPGQILYRTDNVADNYWGSDLAWSPGGSGWVIIVDAQGRVVDFVAWGYTQAELASLQLTVGGHVIGGAAPLTVAGYQYEGNAAVAHPISPSYPDLTGTLLTDGRLGTNDWRSGYAGSQEPTAQGNSGRFQPRVTFDLGSLTAVRSVTITYMVDQSAGIYAPDRVTVSFSTNGPAGVFGGAVSSTGFDDSPDGNPTTYFGARRSLTIDLGGALASAVRLEFLNDREWTFLSEVSFMAASADVGWRGDGVTTSGLSNVSLQRKGAVDLNGATDFAWQPPSPGVSNPGLTSPFPVPPIVTGVGYDQSSTFLGAFATDLLAAMQGRNASVYLRVPFQGAPGGSYATRLRMKYDGGFVASLNGQEIARRNAPAAPTWNSAATAGRTPAEALAFTAIDLPLVPLLPGNNVLAIHGLNDSASSANFLLVPELDAAQAGVASETNVFFSTPTPGLANSSGLPGIAPAPVFSQSPGIQSASFNLAIVSPDPLAQIRYTLDGGEPTMTSLVYTAPIAIQATTLVKARAFRDGQIPSPIRLGSYLRVDPALLSRDSDVPLVILDSMRQSIPGSGQWASLLTAMIDTDATGRARMTNAPDFLGRAGLHVRGSSSTAWPKLNYSLETRDAAGNDRDVGVFGFPADSDWVLHASYLDRTLLRDSLVHDLANQSGNYSVRTRPVEVYLNTGDGVISQADYVGVYIFMERIKRGNDRVNIARLEPSDTTEPGISGGYVLKIDRGVATIPAALSRDFVPADPEDADLTPAQRTWMGNYVAQFEAALSGAGFANPAIGYAQYIDVPSWIDYHIMTELTYNVDEWYLSTYLSKDRGGKLKLGPFWDFDRSLGNTTQIGGAGTTGWYSDALTTFFASYWGIPAAQVVEYPWFRRLFQDANFFQRYVDRYQELRRTVLSETNIAVTIDRLAAARLESQARNYQKWPTLNSAIAPSSLAFPTYQQHVTQLKSWMTQRLAWIDSHYQFGPYFNQNGGAVPDGFQVLIYSPAGGTIYFTIDGSDPRAPGGAVAGTAQAYELPLSITGPTTVQARIRTGTNWSGLTKAVFYPPQDLSRLAVTEIMYHPPAFGALDSDEVEFLEFKNSGASALNLGTLAFTSGLTFTFTNNTWLAPGGFFVLARNQAAFASKYPGRIVNGIYTGRLDNGGETIRLSTLSGGTVLSVAYNDRAPGPVAADGYGFSIVPRSGAPLNSDRGADWRASGAVGGSPGADDPEPAVPTILINEILTHTEPPAVDWIELFNPNPFDVDLGNWFLSDDGGWPAKFRIAPGTIITAGGYRVFTEVQFNAQPGSPDSFALDSIGDAIYLTSGDANTNLTGYSHGFSFDAAANGVSFGRHVISTGEEQFPAQRTTTLNAANSGPLVGPVVISEVHYHPDAGGDEFVELRNLSESAMALFDPLHPTNTWRVNGLAFSFPPNVTLSAQGLLLIVGGDPTAFRSKYGIASETLILGFAGTLQDSGEWLQLQRPDVPTLEGVPYVTVDEVRYNDRAPWPPAADGGGPSLQRKAVSGYANDPSNWEAALPTPGASLTPGLAPVITSQPQSQTIVAEQSVTLSVAAVGAAPFFYQWLFNNDPIAGATNAALSLGSAAPSQAGRYSAVVYNAFGSATSDGAQLTVLSPPTILLPPQGLATNAGATVTFTVTAQGNGPLRYQWRLNLVPITGATNRSLILTNVQPRDSGSYSVVVQDTVGSVVSSPASLTVVAQVAILYQPQSQAAVVGDAVTFEVFASGTAPLGFRWLRNGATVATFALGKSFFTISNLTTFNAGNYTVIITNPVTTAGVTSAPAVLTILADGDGDHLPDSWEIANQFNPGFAGDGNIDTDGDSLSNREEYLAGTDPRDPLSYLKVDRVTAGSGWPTLEFQAVSNKTYSILGKPGLDAGSWTVVTNLPAYPTNRLEQVIDRAPGVRRVYRLATPALRP